jgi:hypothetical protein
MLHLQGAPMRRPFADWLADVDRQLVKRVGLDHGSMEDWPWHAEYSVGTSPDEAVAEWIAENAPRSTMWL